MKNILIEIKSTIEQQEDENHNIEMTTEGEWFEKNGSIFIVYYESEVSGMAGCKTMLKIQEDEITMTRFGDTHSKMVFNVNEPMNSIYKTPYGDFEMSVFTENLEHQLNTETLSGWIDIKYQMILENVSRSVNHLKITVRNCDETHR